MSKLKEHIVVNVIVLSVAVGLIFAGAYIWTPFAVAGMILFTIWSLAFGLI